MKIIFKVNLSVDVESPGWDGYVGFVPQYLEELAPDPTKHYSNNMWAANNDQVCITNIRETKL